MGDQDGSYLYLLESNDKYKIGVSQNVEQRIKELQTGNPNTIVAREEEYFESDREAYSYESTLHDRLVSYQVSGEWFELPSEILEVFDKFSLRRATHILEEYDERLDDDLLLNAINHNYTLIKRLQQNKDDRREAHAEFHNRISNLETKLSLYRNIVAGLIILGIMGVLL